MATYYRYYRIDVVPEAIGDAWNARVWIRLTLVDDPPYVGLLNLRAATEQQAADRGRIWAQRWIDAQQAHSEPA
jgi:hypothetical protein